MDLISRQAAIDVLDAFAVKIENGEPFAYSWSRMRMTELPSAEPETCEGCKHLGKWENEVEYGYPSPCTCCKRRAEDHYER